MKDTLIQKFLKFSYGSWVGLILGLLTTMIVTRLIPVEILGKTAMFSLFMQVGMILTIFGTDQSFGRFFYEEVEEKRGALLYNTLRLPIFNSLLIVLLVVIFYRPITLFLFEQESFVLGVVLAVGILVQLLLRFSQLVIRMQQKGNVFSIIQIFQKLFVLLFTIFFFYLIGESFEVIVYSELISFFLVGIIAIYFGKSLWSFSNLRVKDVRHSQKDILKFGLPFVFTIFISWLFEAFDKLALRQWSTFEELGLYSAATRLVALVLILKSTFSTFWTPVAYEKFENQPENKAFFSNISKMVSFGMFLVAILTIAAKDLIIGLLGSEYEDAALIMPFLVFMPVLYTISETTVIGINFYKKINWHILISILSCGINILGNWLLVPNYGAIGASIATAISFIIFFTLRTYISIMYYKVKYPLVRIYVMIVIVFSYATISIKIESFWGNLLLGIIPLLLLVNFFYKDLIYILKNRRTVLE